MTLGPASSRRVALALLTGVRLATRPAYARFSTSLHRASGPTMSFPCLDKLERRTQMIADKGPEPSYSKAKGYELYKVPGLVKLDYGRTLENVEIAYETWGTLNADKSNAILLHTGLSASSHAKSQPNNTDPGWWERFIGPGLSLDTNKFFIICTNVLGGCYGSTGPSSLSPEDGKPYATRFPIVTIHDMIRVQHRLITEHLGISKLFASVGSSMGGLQSLAYAVEFTSNVGRVATISACARSHPSSIAMRHVQRQALMADPNWKRGFYYDGVPPHVGMKLARQLATITYRSGPEWEDRFGRDRMDPEMIPALCPDFLIETYLDHQGEKFCLEYDPNSLLYVSKAMDMFDLGYSNSLSRARWRDAPETEPTCSLPNKPYDEKPRDHIQPCTKADLAKGMAPMAQVPTFVLGVQSDVLFPAWQQREVYDVLCQAAGQDHRHIEYVELGYAESKFGHDTFILDIEHVGKPLQRFLER